LGSRAASDPQTRDIPIIGMSAHAVQSEREKAIATGCDEFDGQTDKAWSSQAHGPRPQPIIWSDRSTGEVFAVAMVSASMKDMHAGLGQVRSGNDEQTGLAYDR